MFRIPTLLGTLLFFTIGLFWTSYLCYFKQNSFSQKQMILLKESLAQSAVSSATQNRKLVRKDLWISDPSHHRLQSRIECRSSLLTLEPKASSLHVIEYLEGVEGWSQEKMVIINKAPSYQMRAFTAKEGKYMYDTQTFQAVDAGLSLYVIPGLSLITNVKNHTPFLQGTAEQVFFSLEKGMPSFQAQHFKAKLQEGAKRR